MSNNTPYVTLKLTQAQHNQLKKALALIISVHHDNAAYDKEVAKTYGAHGHKDTAKIFYRDSRKNTSRANRLASLQKTIKKPANSEYYVF